jgi:gamma-polyglutamate biosynthesis protein CapA
MILKFIIILALLSSPIYFILFYHKQYLIAKPIVLQSQNLLTSVNTERQFEPIPPSIDRIFNEDHSWTDAIPSERKRVLIATGDVIPARSVNFQASQREDFRWPYLKVSDVLKNADITFINLETPLIDPCPVTQEGMIFCGNARNVEGLVFAGVDIVSLANNHAANYGSVAVDKTKELLNNNRILATGINGAEFVDIRGTKFAFLGYNDITKPQPVISNVDEEKIKSDILAAKEKADIIIVTYHWGTEYRSQPDERQKYLGRLAIDSGADLVIGNHPHWIQPVEIYRNKLIIYAHGNFVFDQEWSLKTKQGVVGKYTFYDNQLVDVEFLPLQIENYGQPYFLTDSTKKAILKSIRLESEKLRMKSN